MEQFFLYQEKKIVENLNLVFRIEQVAHRWLVFLAGFLRFRRLANRSSGRANNIARYFFDRLRRAKRFLFGFSGCHIVLVGNVD